MVASSSTFRPTWDRSLGICPICCMQYGIGMEALVYSDHTREAAASTCLAIILPAAYLVTLLNSGADAVPALH